MTTAPLFALAEQVGIVPAYHDFDGREHVAGRETVEALLTAMGFATDEASVRDLIAAHDAEQAARYVPPDIVITAETATELPLMRPADQLAADMDEEAKVDLICEDGRTLSCGLGSTPAGVMIRLPELPIGYHRLTHGGFDSLVISAPTIAPALHDLTGMKRGWGVMASLYGLRSSRNAGLGDFADLADFARAAANEGAAFIGLNPVHALGTSADHHSPYSPSHRGFLNSRLIAVDQVPEVIASQNAQRLLQTSEPVLENLRNSDLIQHADVTQVKSDILRAAFDDFDQEPADGPRHCAFSAYMREGGATLRHFCIFETISEHHGSDWLAWPEAFQDAGSQATQSFAETHDRDVRFHAYLQWIAETQLAKAQDTATSAGMSLGLYLDLAVGVRPCGAETWAGERVFARGVSLGAPPDAFSSTGQIWQLAPFNPATLKGARYRPFIDTIRTLLCHAGMIRIDHAIGLMRCFWIPDRAASARVPGAYVTYPFDVLLAILRVEAQRANALIIAEDLGLVPANLREALGDAGLYRCSVMQFERSHEDVYRAPSAYPKRALASFATHDTPTVAGFWHGRDIDERTRVGDLVGDAIEHQRATRRHHCHQLAEMAGLSDGPHSDNDVCMAVHTALADCSSDLVAVQFDDIICTHMQPNLPGTTHEYPNWQLKYDTDVASLTDDARLKGTGAIMRNAGRCKRVLG
ncbi:MAG: 4-alpha-glucanotransferase [Pseudomonadota bacterium]